MFRSIYFFLVVSLLLSGCANQLAVTYLSDPPSAAFYNEGKNYGYTPVVLYYEVTEANRQSKSIALQGPNVIWRSGATAGVGRIDIDLAQGYSQAYTFHRPSDVAGRENDERFALQMQPRKHGFLQILGEGLKGAGSGAADSKSNSNSSPTD